MRAESKQQVNAFNKGHHKEAIWGGAKGGFTMYNHTEEAGTACPGMFIPGPALQSSPTSKLVSL